MSSCSWSHSSSASRWHTLDVLTSRATGLMGTSQHLECHTLHNTSKLQPVVRRPVRGSSFPGTSCWSCPNSTFPLVQLPTPCSGSGLSPVQNGDFVWHLVLGTLLGLFLGTGPAGQVCKSMTHTQKPAASASHSCRLLTSLLFPLLAQGGLSPSYLPISHFKGWDFPRSSPAFVICQ